MLTFEVNKQVDIKISLKKLKQVALAFNECKKWKKDKYFSLAFVDSKTIKKLNNTYRGKDKPTDVLSFTEEFKDFIETPDDSGYMGEIIIGVAVAKKQAKELKHSLEKEIVRLMVHGLAHLAGYEHENVSQKEVEKMEGFERKVIEYI